MAARARVSEAVVAVARRLFETTDLAEAEIARRAQLNRCTMRGRIKSEGWLRRDHRAGRTRMVASLREKVEREIEGAEAALVGAFGGQGQGADGGDPEARDIAGAERIARTLASLVRTLRDLARYDEERAAPRREEAGDDAVTDIDALREALADRLDQLRERGQP